MVRERGADHPRFWNFDILGGSRIEMARCMQDEGLGPDGCQLGPMGMGRQPSANGGDLGSPCDGSRGRRTERRDGGARE